jgi:hypothetical protein
MVVEETGQGDAGGHPSTPTEQRLTRRGVGQAVQAGLLS